MASIIGKLVLNPILTAPLLLLLTRAPAEVREPILQQLSQYLSYANIAKAITTLRWLTAIGLGRWLHNYANELAHNNFRFSSEKHRYDWPNEYVVVTGAAGGFGSLFCKDLAAKGVNVIAVDITDDLPADMKSNPKMHYYKCDITNKQAVDALGEKIRAEHGNPSVLINNAGIALNHSILNATQAQLEKIFAVNLLSHYYTTQAFLPAMITARKGHIVTIASMASFVSPPEMVSYANTKVGALSFHEGLAAEATALHGVPEVKFTVVHPTFAATPLVAAYTNKIKASGQAIIDPQDVSDEVVRQILSCKGAQLLIPSQGVVVSCLRGLPSWFSQALLRLGGLGAPQKGVE